MKMNVLLYSRTWVFLGIFFLTTTGISLLSYGQNNAAPLEPFALPETGSNESVSEEVNGQTSPQRRTCGHLAPSNGPTPQHPPQHRARDHEERERAEERIRMLRAWQLTENLDLDTGTATRLFQHLDEHEGRLHPERETLEAAAQQLRQLLENDSPSEDEVNRIADAIMDQHLEIERLRVNMVRETEAFLSPTQRARLMLFLPNFERQVREMIQTFRHPRDSEHLQGRPPQNCRPGPGHFAPHPPQ
jgi:hypothetical protein